MKLSVQISGADAISKILDRAQSKVREAGLKALTDAILSIHGTAVQSIQGHLTVEKTVTRYNPKREAEVSEPLATPNSDLGKLAQSVEFNIDEEAMTGKVGSNLKYAAYLEFGTTKMVPRPWLYPAVEANKDKIKDIFSTEYQDSLKAVK